MKKAETIELAKANNAGKDFILRLQEDQPLDFRNLEWAYAYRLDLGYQVYLRTVTANGLTLEYVPEKYRTPEICMVAVKQNGAALKHVPEEKRTYEICRVAFQRKGWALMYVPEKYRHQIETEFH